MNLEAQCRKQLERDEGRSSTLYYDSLQIPTIGIGRNLKRGLSADEIDYLFANDYRNHHQELIAALPWAKDLDEARFGALLNMAFNMGVPKLLGFKNMLTAIAEARWNDAVLHALNSVWASQVKGRAVRIAEQIRTGVWK